MTQLTADALELAEAKAFASLLRSAPRSLGLSVVEDEERIALFAPAIPALILNRVIEIRSSSGDGLDALMTRYRDLGAKDFGVQLSPSLETPAMVETLARLQLTKRDAWTKFHRPATPAPEVRSDLIVEQVGPVAFVEFGRVACEGFGMPVARTLILASTIGEPNWMHYLVYDGHTAVAAAAMHIHAGLGWLGLQATLHAHRKRGAQSLLIARSIADGIQAGCTAFVAETAPDDASSRNFARSGFTVVYQRPNYLPV